jgi:holo-ACP synthase/triphosphoribosyl-dephospho-CoA synthase
MESVTLSDILAAKEQRAEVQTIMCRRYSSPVVCFSVNIPGAIKYTPDAVSLIYRAADLFRDAARAENFPIHEERFYHRATGPEAIVAISAQPFRLKQVAISVEETGFGRLLDIDVIDFDGTQVSRRALGLTARDCLVCQRPALECIRSQAHQLPELSKAVDNLFKAFRAEQTKGWPPVVQAISKLALEAVLMETACTPAPGLVDRANSGAHSDMDYFTFIKSTAAISETLGRCAAAGWYHTGEPQELMPVLRVIGRDGERCMFSATQGVNTQKGLVFLFGVLTAAAAFTLQSGFERLIDRVLQCAAAICRGLVERELQVLRTALPGRQLTAGERLFLECGVTGIRGELENQLPSVMTRGLPSLDEALRAGLNLNDALVHTLVGLISLTQDTTIINRHGLAVLQEVQHRAEKVMWYGGMISSEGRGHIARMDREFTERNISPGGSADLLAATYFLHGLSRLWNGDAYKG